jgi:hypothetical protein
MLDDWISLGSSAFSFKCSGCIFIYKYIKTVGSISISSAWSLGVEETS